MADTRETYIPLTRDQVDRINRKIHERVETGRRVALIEQFVGQLFPALLIHKNEGDGVSEVFDDAFSFAEDLADAVIKRFPLVPDGE